MELKCFGILLAQNLQTEMAGCLLQAHIPTTYSLHFSFCNFSHQLFETNHLPYSSQLSYSLTHSADRQSGSI